LRWSPRNKLAGHFHAIYGQALTNIYASLLEGIAVFDSSVAGLAGCDGTVATEDLLYQLDNLGIETEVDLTAVIAAGKCISAVLGRETGSRVARAG
jgi:hydroxymethylglutaryl-CoA lyase